MKLDMKLIAIIIGKILIMVGAVLKKGSSLPGKIALKIDKSLLNKFSYPQNRIVITGSSGKGSTSRLIASVLKKEGYKVCHNNTGANLSYGITSTLIKNSTLFGKIKADYLVLEIDERYNKEVLKFIKPDYLVLTNLTKDQPPRQHTIDMVYRDVTSSIPKSTAIITLMDEPFLRNIAQDLPNKVSYFGLAKNKYSYHQQIFENLNKTYCPKCGQKLIYEYYNFETLGKYKCSKCSFKYEEPLVLGKNLDLETQTLSIDNNPILIGGDTLYDAYNTLSAYALLKKLNLKSSTIAQSINEIRKEPQVPYFENNGQQFRYFDCKSENATTFNAALFKIKNDPTSKDIIIGWSIISKRYPHTDVSWLYDIEFELLNNEKTNKIYVCGLNKYDLQKRLILSGIPEEKIIVKESIPELKTAVLTSKTPHVYCLSHYDYGAIFNKTFKEANDEN